MAFLYPAWWPGALYFALYLRMRRRTLGFLQHSVPLEGEQYG